MNRPNMPNNPVTASATRVARRAATFRDLGDILRVSPRNTGSSPGGSRITHNVRTVEVKTYPYELTALPSRGTTLVGLGPFHHAGPPPGRGGKPQNECRGRW